MTDGPDGATPGGRPAEGWPQPQAAQRVDSDDVARSADEAAPDAATPDGATPYEAAPDAATPDEAPNLEDWPSARPILVGVASLLLLMLAAAELLLSVLVTALILNGYKGPLLVSVGLALLAAWTIVIGVRIRGGRGWRSGLAVAIMAVLVAPQTALSIATLAAASIVIIALVYHRAWFAAARPPGA